MLVAGGLMLSPRPDVEVSFAAAGSGTAVALPAVLLPDGANSIVVTATWRPEGPGICNAILARSRTA